MNNLPEDKMNSIGVLKRREIEARILAPFVQALGEEFDRQKVLEILRQVIIDVARSQGAALVETMGGDGLEQFAPTLEAWKKDDALQIEVLEQSEEKFSFNVTRCRYAELYRALGIPELGELRAVLRVRSAAPGPAA